MKLYMQNREHGRMILESVEHGPLIWPTIEDNGMTRTKKYNELSATEKIQADCDLKVTNIIPQGLSSDVYSLVNHHRVAKDLWERVQLLMQGTPLTKQEKECKLYDAFDKFAHIKGASLHQYYLKFTQLINDINIYKMKLEKFQVNTKFLNSLPPEWSKFVTDVKLVRDLHTTNFDQLHAYLKRQELQANEVCIMRERNQDLLALMDSGLKVPVFKQGDDPIDAINKMMSFLSTIISSRFPTTNNTPRIFSNPRQPATINDGRVTVQPVQGRQSSFAAGTSGTRANISGIGGNNSGLERVVKCFNCQGEGHMARQCPKPNMKRGATWFRDKVILVEEELEFLEFLADPRSIKNDLRKFKGKDIVDNAVQVSNDTTSASGMYKLNRVTLAPKDKNNRETHIYYLKHTMEQAVILREIVKQAKSLNPLDSTYYSACKFVKLIQELLGYVRYTCLDIHKPSEKLVVVTPINKKKKVRSKSTDNTKNDRILQISSSTQKKNKVEDHSRIVKV
nr:hypothetical protein [Tanacetum cinerariifolium]